MTEQTITLTDAQLRDLVTNTVHATLTSIGIEVTDPITMQKDFAWLRGWRESAEEVKSKGILALVTLAVTGLAGAVLLAIRGTGAH